MNMNVMIEIGVLYLARLSPLFIMPNLLPIAKLPTTVKVVLLVSLAGLMMVSVPTTNVTATLNGIAYSFLVGQEFLIGIGLLFGVQTTFAAVLFAGKLVDLQLGFGVASVLDPMTRNHEALIGSFLNLLFTFSFFALDVHHTLLSGIATTFLYFPVGSQLILPTSTHLLSFFSSQFVLGIMIVMPVILGLFLLDVIIAFTSRTMPQVNVYFVSLPLKIFIGLSILGVSLKYMSGFVENVFSKSVNEWFSHLQVLAK